jgi:hypothetical protein
MILASEKAQWQALFDHSRSSLELRRNRPSAEQHGQGHHRRLTTVCAVTIIGGSRPPLQPLAILPRQRRRAVNGHQRHDLRQFDLWARPLEVWWCQEHGEAAMVMAEVVEQVDISYQ